MWWPAADHQQRHHHQTLSAIIFDFPLAKFRRSREGGIDLKEEMRVRADPGRREKRIRNFSVDYLWRSALKPSCNAQALHQRSQKQW